MIWSSFSRRSSRAGLATLWLAGMLAGSTAGAVEPVAIGNAAVSANEAPLYSNWTTLRQADGLPSDKVFCVTRAGDTVWAGTENGLARLENGVITVQSEADGLPHRVVNALAFSPRTGDLWIATMGGLARLSGGRIDAFTQLNSGLINDVVYAVAIHEDEVWAATAAGVSVYHTRDRRWELFDHTNTLMHEPWCYGLSVTPDLLYVAVWGGGVVEHAWGTSTWKEYRDPDREMEIDLLRDDGLIHDVTTGVAFAEGTLWVGTYFGLSRYDGRRWRSWLEHDSGLPSNFINYVWSDGPNVWLCTDRGLAWFDGVTWVQYQALPETSPAERNDPIIRVPNTIAHDFVLGVHVQDNEIWVATADGLSHGRRAPDDMASLTNDSQTPGGY